MKARAALAIILCIITVFASGCFRREAYALPDEPTVFYTYSYLDSEDREDAYNAIIYNERAYLPYGTLTGTLNKSSDVECVLGYVFNSDFPDDDGERVIKLNGTDDFLMLYYVKGVMEQPMFYRAVDTMEQDIFIPDYIESLGYDIWD